LLLLLFVLSPLLAFAQQKPTAPKKQGPSKSAPAKTATVKGGASPASVAAPVEALPGLARELRDTESPRSYDRLAAFARAHSKSAAGQRAALALGYRDYTLKRHAQARQWLAAAARDDVLEEYALYWDAMSLRALGDEAAALRKFEEHRRRFPESVMAASTLQNVAELALASGDPRRTLAVLDAHPDTASKPWLLILRARAREAIGSRAGAVADYIQLYYDFPLTDQADSAGRRIVSLRQSLNPEMFAVAPERRVARAQAFFDARRWKEARAEYEGLLPDLGGAARERVRLRIAQCRVNLRAAPAVLASLRLEDADVDAERLLVLAQVHRGRRDENAMLAAVEEAALRYPQSPWTEEALFLAANWHWTQLDRARAAQYYQRILDGFPGGKNLLPAHWRVIWTAYLERRANLASQFEDHLRRFPGSANTENALYWLGRIAEREGNAAHARTFYLKLRERFPQTYFGAQAIARLSVIGNGATNSSDVIALIPPLPPAPVLPSGVPAAAQERWKRAQALRSIAFDASAELELRAAHAATPSPRLLLEAAKAAFDAGRRLPGVAAARQAFPQIEARRWQDVPPEVWHAAYPVTYEAEIEKYSARREVDAALVTGIIRQESVFQRDAVSRAGAVGLMQVIPKTGRQLARRERISYTRGKLTAPDFNIRLGTLHLKDLFLRLDSVEKVLAAYNAGESRVVAWQAERRYEEPAEFVESIPFTETREYVQVVSRNAEIYRRLLPGQSARNLP
jgi:soluble lytic murein transglycosylase